MAKTSKSKKTGETIRSLALKALSKPKSLSKKEIRALGASALTQRPDLPLLKLPKKKS